MIFCFCFLYGILYVVCILLAYNIAENLAFSAWWFSLQTPKMDFFSGLSMSWLKVWDKRLVVYALPCVELWIVYYKFSTAILSREPDTMLALACQEMNDPFKHLHQSRGWQQREIKDFTRVIILSTTTIYSNISLFDHQAIIVVSKMLVILSKFMHFSITHSTQPYTIYIFSFTVFKETK